MKTLDRAVRSVYFIFLIFFCWISGLCWIIGLLSGWLDNVRDNVLAIDYVAALFFENSCYHCKQQCFIYVTLKKISNLNFLPVLVLCLFLLLFIKQNPFTLLLRAWLHEGGGPQVGEVTRGKLPHLTYKRDHIKMRDYMDKRVTSPTWGAPRSGAWKLFTWRFDSREAGISTFSFRTILNIASDSKLTSIIGRFRQRLDLTDGRIGKLCTGSRVQSFPRAFSFGIEFLSFTSTVCFRKTRLVCN